jgi:hypothetical protein
MNNSALSMSRSKTNASLKNRSKLDLSGNSGLLMNVNGGGGYTVLREGSSPAVPHNDYVEIFDGRGLGTSSGKKLSK